MQIFSHFRINFRTFSSSFPLWHPVGRGRGEMFQGSQQRVFGFPAATFCIIYNPFPGDDRKGFQGACNKVPGRISRKSLIRFQVWLRLVLRVKCDKLSSVSRFGSRKDGYPQEVAGRVCAVGLETLCSRKRVSRRKGGLNIHVGKRGERVISW